MKDFFASKHLIRNLFGNILLENFLIAAVVSVFLIRVYLELTGYPQVGGAHFHIAHMLYGGLMMLFSMVILFAFLNRSAIFFAAILGGVGFGFFIDEVGKFVTKDNNYFFHPTFAIIYVIFILIYVISEALPKIKRVSEKEYLANALDIVKEVVIQDLDSEEKRLALSYLAKSDKKNPLVSELKEVLSSYVSQPAKEHFYSKTKRMVMHVVRRFSESQKFYNLVIFILSVKSALYLSFALLIVATMSKSGYILASIFVAAGILYFLAKYRSLITVLGFIVIMFLLLGINFLSDQQLTLNISFIEAASLISIVASSMVAVAGMLQLHYSRQKGLEYIRISLLLSIFLTQFFQFYSEQLFAVIGLTIDILMLLTIETVLQRIKLVAAKSSAGK